MFTASRSFFTYLIVALFSSLQLCWATLTDYSNPANWAFWNEGSPRPADLFIVAPTVDLGEKGNTNANLQDKDFRAKFIGALRMELGIYSDQAAIFAPFYQQATLAVYGFSLQKARPCMDLAYADVKAAFLHYLANSTSNRPLILAGFSQGSEMILRLLKEYFHQPTLQNRLIAAYAIGWRITPNELRQFPHLRMAQHAKDTGVIISFNSESPRIQSSLFAGPNQKTCSINPLNWKTDSTPANSTLNRGACFTDYQGRIVKEIPHLTGAQIDPNRGTLKILDIHEEDYPAILFENGIYHLYDYQFFYRNLQHNVQLRTQSYLK